MKLAAFTHSAYFSIFPQGEFITSRAHGIDISKYDLFFEPELATSQLDFVVQRISYRTTRDEWFEKLLPGVMSVPIRMGYHYLTSDASWRAQADAYLSFVAGFEYHAHFCDFEEKFNIMSVPFAKSAWDWIHYVQDKTGKPVLLYTSPYLYQDWITPSQTKYGINWNTIDLWTAQWFYIPNPDGNPYIPRGRTTGWKLWQYTAKGDGTKFGVSRSWACDLNVYNGSVAEMRQWLNIGDDAIPPIINTEYQEVRRFGSDCHIVMADLNKYDVLATNTGGSLRTVSSIALEHKAKIAINGDGWNKLTPSPHYPLSIAASDGNVYQRTQKDDRPFLNITRDKRIQIAWNDMSELYNTISGTRFVTQNGVKNPAFSGPEIEYTERHPRTCIGRKTDGRLILVVVDGRSEVSSGVILSELADLMLELGAVDALEFDGGGSSAMWYDVKIVNIPSGGQERPVINHLVLIEKQIEIGAKMTKGIAKVATNIKPMVGGNAIATLQVGEYVYGDLSATKSDLINFTHYYRANGARVELGAACKVFIGTNLTLVNEAEPTGETPPPDPDIPPDEPGTPAKFPNMGFNFDLIEDGKIVAKVRADRPVVVMVDEGNTGTYIEYKKPA